MLGIEIIKIYLFCEYVMFLILQLTLLIRKEDVTLVFPRFLEYQKPVPVFAFFGFEDERRHILPKASPSLFYFSA